MASKVENVEKIHSLLTENLKKFSAEYVSDLLRDLRNEIQE